MAYNETSANRVRKRFAELPNIEEKEMMGGLTFMFNDKMCVGIIKDELMGGIDRTLHDTSLEKIGCRTMDFTKRPMKGYIMIDDNGMKSQKDFDFWIDLALDFNKKAKSSRRKNSTTASRVSKGTFTSAPHETVREPLDSYGSSRCVVNQ